MFLTASKSTLTYFKRDHSYYVATHLESIKLKACFQRRSSPRPLLQSSEVRTSFLRQNLVPPGAPDSAKKNTEANATFEAFCKNDLEFPKTVLNL